MVSTRSEFYLDGMPAPAEYIHCLMFQAENGTRSHIQNPIFLIEKKALIILHGIKERYQLQLHLLIAVVNVNA